MINLELLQKLNACESGIESFKKQFGDKSVSVFSVFSSIDKEYVIWLCVELIKIDLTPLSISDSINDDSKKKNIGYTAMYIKNNYPAFSNSVKSHPASKDLHPL